jgi:hypothetical protein
MQGIRLREVRVLKLIKLDERMSNFKEKTEWARELHRRNARHRIDNTQPNKNQNLNCRDAIKS